MSASIMTSTKQILGLSESYTPFDLDVMTHINATFATLHQIGVGPDTVFQITDSTTEWSAFTVPAEQLGLVKTYVYLKVKLLFDPPTTSFHLEAMNKQIAEFEWRLSSYREEVAWDAAQAALLAAEEA